MADERDPDDELGALGRWAAEQRVVQAVGERRRTAWLGRQTEDATLAGLFVAVAEQRRPVVVELADGRRHRGIPTVVGRDVAGLRTGTDRVVLVALHAIRSVRVTDEVGDVPPIGPGPHTDLAGELARRAEERPRVGLATVGAPGSLAGTLLAAGPHLVTVRLDGGDVAYVPLAALADVSLPESG